MSGGMLADLIGCSRLLTQAIVIEPVAIFVSFRVIEHAYLILSLIHI